MPDHGRDKPTTQPQLPCAITVSPSTDIERWRLSVPAKPATYLLCDASDRPVLLATAGNLRHVLVNRLGPADPDAAPAKRTDYRAITRGVYWRPAYSAFEANWALLENARRLIPQRYRRMVRHWKGHWLHVDRAAAHPRFTAHPELRPRAGEWFGPLPTAASAKRVIETLTDVCDLCRYHEILVKAPGGEACAYKEMGRCPAPCDGSVPMRHYHGQIDQAVGLLAGDRQAWRDQQGRAMKRAAAALNFEHAQRLKQRLDAAGVLERGELRDMRPLRALRLLVVQRGRRKRCPRLFIVTPGCIALLGELQRRDREGQLDWAATTAAALFDQPMPKLDRPAAERIGLVSWHLLRGDREKGRFIPISAGATPEVLRATLAAQIESPGRDATGADA